MSGPPPKGGYAVPGKNALGLGTNATGRWRMCVNESDRLSWRRSVGRRGARSQDVERVRVSVFGGGWVIVRVAIVFSDGVQ